MAAVKDQLVDLLCAAEEAGLEVDWDSSDYEQTLIRLAADWPHSDTAGKLRFQTQVRNLMVAA